MSSGVPEYLVTKSALSRVFYNEARNNERKASSLMKDLGRKLDTNFVLHYSSVMKNVTITLEEEVARWARIRAAELNTSVSRLVGDMLRQKMDDDERYERAMREYLAKKPLKLKKPGEQYPRREDLYGR